MRRTVMEVATVSADPDRPAVSQVVARVDRLGRSSSCMAFVANNALGVFPPAVLSEDGVSEL